VGDKFFLVAARPRWAFVEQKLEKILSFCVHARASVFSLSEKPM
jgi:hypothetical protein